MASVSATALPDENLSLKRRRAALTRVRREDWNEMTRAMNESPRHPGNIQRWIDLAQAENPHLDDEQIGRLALMLKTDYYARLSQAGHEAKRIRAEIDNIEGTDGAE